MVPTKLKTWQQTDLEGTDKSKGNGISCPFALMPSPSSLKLLLFFSLSPTLTTVSQVLCVFKYKGGIDAHNGPSQV